MLIKVVLVAGAAMLAVLLLMSSVSAAALNALHTAAPAPSGVGATSATPDSNSGYGGGLGGAPPTAASPDGSGTPDGERPGVSGQAVADIPPGYLPIYRAAAASCPGLPWTVLAAIGKIESDHGRSRLPGVADSSNSSGAMGPMQLLAATFAVYSRAIPPGGAHPPSPYNPHDAIHTAAADLCASGARDHRDPRAAIFAYNHAEWYVNQVLTQANRYATAATNTPPNTPAPSTPGGPPSASPGRAISRTPASSGSVGEAVVAFARAEIGQPYRWGGDGRADGGFDCSGLTRAAWASVGVSLPRTAHTQYLAGPLLAADSPAQPGDLVFFGTRTHIHHVAIATGHGSQIIHAPDVGQHVSLGDWRTFTDVLAISRPTARPSTR